jgi:GxxExxY protein
MNIKPKNYQNSYIAPIPDNVEIIAKKVLDAAFKVHTALGPGLLESVYETCLAHEIRGSGLKVESQIALPIVYEGIIVESGLRLDLFIEKCMIVEVKAVETIIQVHKAQLLSYLKLANVRLGLLINFIVVHLRDGIIRLVL